MLYSPQQIGNMGKSTIFMSILGGLILGKALWENAWGKMRDKSQLGKLMYGEFAYLTQYGNFPYNLIKAAQ